MNHITSVQDGRSIPLAPAAPHEAKQKTGTREHVAYIEYFRALAILLIVSGHTYALAWTHFVAEDPQLTVSWLNIIPAIITGGTAYFVFISGFLYRQVFFGRTSYGEFMRKKALYVGLPYVILATPLALAEMSLGAFTVTAVKEGVPYGHNAFVDFIVLFSTGRMVTAYWYIPFIFIVFLASPLFDRFIALPKWPKTAAFAGSVALALWVVRPIDNLNPIHSFLYFCNFYMFGILFCEHRKAIMAFITKPAVIATLAVLLIGIAATQALVVELPGNLERVAGDGWGPIGFDMMLVQKYVGVFLFCAVLSRWGGALARPFGFVADHSFGLFFTHGVVIAILMRMPAPLSPHIGEPMADLAVYSLFVILVSLTIVVLVKYFTGKYSRYVIGC